MAQDLLECSVCLQTLENAHLLPRCGHSFCLRCIQSLPHPARCPLCRLPCNPRQATPNFALQHLVQSAGHAAPAPEAGTGRWPAPKLRRQSTSSEAAKRAYRDLGVPPKLAAELAAEDSEIALRIYLLDNSGSMCAPDGGVLQRTSQGHWSRAAATRWQELTETAATHASWNSALGVPCEFVMLNSPNPGNPVEGRDIFTVNAELGDAHGQVEVLRQSLGRHVPAGRTPLGARVDHICQRLGRSAAELHGSGRKIILTVATDGVPDSRPELVRALRELMARLPIRVVIRLCTDESAVVEFYHDLDKDLDMPLDVIDDFWGETREVRRRNPWLVYTPMMQTIREAGTFIRILDFADERPLTPIEVALCSQLLVQEEGQPPYPTVPMEFLRAIEKDLAASASVFDMSRQRMTPPLDWHTLRAAICPQQYGGAAGLARTVGLGSVVDWYFGMPADSDSENGEERQGLAGLWFDTCNSQHPASTTQMETSWA